MKKYCVYGIGGLGQKVVDLILQNKDEVVSIYEMNPIIKEYKKITINPIKNIDSSHMNYTFVIAIWNSNIDLGQLKQSLLELGIKDVIFAGELTNCYEFEHFMFASREFIENNLNKINKVKGLLNDTKSIELFTRLIQLRQYYDFENEILLDEQQYFPIDVTELSSINWRDQVFLDLGAFTGDTLLDILKFTDKVKYYYGVEPDDFNADLLQTTILDNNVNGEVLRVASGNKNDTVYFMQGGGVSSRVLESETSNAKAVQLLRFDEFNFSHIPSIIKMDIEGAEKNTLQGLEGIIKNKKPILMVCLYHTKDDLWELPLLINEMRNDYKFYIRQHYPNGLETVLYCV